jgi:hypothetical protein
MVLGSLACQKLPEGVKRSSFNDRKKKKNHMTKVPADKKRERAADKLVEVSNPFHHVCYNCDVLGACSYSSFSFYLFR